MARGLVVVVHPGVQHSRELVRALHQGKFLSRFVTSSNGGLSDAAWLPDRIRNRLRARVTEGVPKSMVVTLPYIEATVWLATPLLSHRLGQRLAYAALDLFDRLAAARAVSSGPRIVVGVENSCRRTFRQAKSAGALCVLDAASVHHAAQPGHDRDMDVALREHVRRRKEEEIRLADHIVVLSAYARDTYAAAGVPTEKISIIAPGVRLPDAARIGSRAIEPGVRFLFVGNVKHAKGIDLLLAAFSQLDVADKRLEIAGALAEPDALPDPLARGVEYLGKLDRNALFEAYARADVLVLPSRADGFGFVVAEAMGCGLPAIVSSAVGAKDFVVHGETGWIFESGNTDGLRQAMAEAVARRDDWPAMGGRAREVVAGLTWSSYGERIRALFSQLLENPHGLRAAR